MAANELIQEGIDLAGQGVQAGADAARSFVNTVTDKTTQTIGSSSNPQPLIITRGNDTGGQCTFLPSLLYPLDLLDGDGKHPFMEIISFAYTRSSESRKDTPGRGWVNPMEPLETKNWPSKLNYVLRLPIQANMINGFNNVTNDTNGAINNIAAKVFGKAAPGVTAAERSSQNNDAASGSSVGDAVGRLFNESFADVDAGIQTILAAMTGRFGIDKGMTINPSIEVAYSHTGMRTHQFDITMVPRSAAEAQEIERILYYVQKFSLGRVMNAEYAGLMTEYPALHEVRFYAWGKDPTDLSATPKEIKGLTRIPDSFIQSINVVHNPIPAFRLTTDNRPVATRLTIILQEIRAVTRDDFEKLFIKTDDQYYTQA